MNLRWIAVLSLGVVLALPIAGKAGQQQKQQGPPQSQAPTTEKDQRSYALGLDLGGQLRKLAVDVEPSTFARGLSDGLSGGKTLMTEDEVKQAIARLQAELKSRQMLSGGATDQGQAEANRKAGEAFLAANAHKDGVITLASGLQYKVLTAGTGRKPGLGDTVVCQYRGTLVDGSEFDSSYARKMPATFPVNGVIPGWTEALQMMPAGSKWELYIPPKLAYGERGAGDKIGPNATLVFEIDLVSIK